MSLVCFSLIILLMKCTAYKIIKNWFPIIAGTSNGKDTYNLKFSLFSKNWNSRRNWFKSRLKIPKGYLVHWHKVRLKSAVIVINTIFIFFAIRIIPEYFVRSFSLRKRRKILVCIILIDIYKAQWLESEACPSLDTAQIVTTTIIFKSLNTLEK